MNKVQNDNDLPLTVRLALDKIDDVELAIAASIDRFVHTSGARLSSAIEPRPGATYGFARQVVVVSRERPRCRITNRPVPRKRPPVAP